MKRISTLRVYYTNYFTRITTWFRAHAPVDMDAMNATCILRGCCFLQRTRIPRFVKVKRERGLVAAGSAIRDPGMFLLQPRRRFPFCRRTGGIASTAVSSPCTCDSSTSVSARRPMGEQAMQVTGNRAWGANSAYFCCKLKWALANRHGWYYGVVLLRAAAVMVEASVQASAFDNHYPFCGAQCTG